MSQSVRESLRHSQRGDELQFEEAPQPAEQPQYPERKRSTLGYNDEQVVNEGVTSGTAVGITLSSGQLRKAPPIKNTGSAIQTPA